MCTNDYTISTSDANGVTVLLVFLRPPGLLRFIDHVVGNQPEDAMVSIAEW